MIEDGEFLVLLIKDDLDELGCLVEGFIEDSVYLFVGISSCVLAGVLLK